MLGEGVVEVVAEGYARVRVQSVPALHQLPPPAGGVGRAVLAVGADERPAVGVDGAGGRGGDGGGEGFVAEAGEALVLVERGEGRRHDGVGDGGAGVDNAAPGFGEGGVGGVLQVVEKAAAAQGKRGRDRKGLLPYVPLPYVPLP